MTQPPESEAVRRLHAQYATARALAESASLPEAAPKILKAVCETLGWEHGGLWRVDGAAGVLRCVETWHPSPGAFPEFDAVSRRTTFAAGVGLPGRVWASRRPAWIPDVVRDTNFPRAPIAAREGLHGAFGFPILIREEVLGVLEFFSREIREPDAELLEMFATIGSQIGQFSERKRVEGEAATLFRLSQDMLCIADFGGYFRELNPAWERTFGYTREELLAVPYLDLVHPDDRAATLAEARRVARGSETVLFDTRYRHKDGSYRWLSWTATPLVGQGLIYATARDVTEQKRVAGELLAARQAADAASRAKSDFLANMSHEIRTPMNAVIGMTELLLDTPLSPDQRDYLLSLKDAAESLLGLINDILDFSKIEAGKLELSPTAFDLREALGDTLRTLGMRAHQKGLELACEVAPDVPERLVGDAARLRQVIVNLVGNAIKFTERGEVVLQVARAADEAGEVSLRFLVADTGIGIPVEKQGMIFDAFAQADGSTTRQYGGTGLGLSISAQLVRMMGGHITVESEAGRGSRFRFTARFALPGPAAASRAARLPARLRNLRVLVVDDNATNRRILEQMLSHWHFRPTAVGGARAALEELERAVHSRRPFPLVLLDANMPGVDGFTLAEQIKQRPRLAGASIMMLSSGARPGDRARCLELGLSAYLTKPVKQSDLLDTIMGVLAARPRAAPPPPHDHAARVPRPGRRLRVLVAEDNVVNQEVAARILERGGHASLVANNGREALALLEKERFDLILMDVQMPELDGFETTAAIRGREKATGAHIPIVAVTAHAMKGDAERCLAAGMDAYVAKPLRSRELLSVMMRLVGGSPRTPAAAPPAPGVPTESQLLELVEGDSKALARLARLFLTDSRKLMQRIRRATESKDARELQAAAHTLKGSAAIFAATGATEAAARLQQMGESGNLAGARDACLGLEAELTLLWASIEPFTSKPPRRRGSRGPRKRTRERKPRR